MSPTEVKSKINSGLPEEICDCDVSNRIKIQINSGLPVELCESDVSNRSKIQNK